MKNSALIIGLAGLILGCGVGGTGRAADGGAAGVAPLLPLLERFTAPDVPAVGPDEIPVDPPNWKVSPGDPNLPGKGLFQHSMLYVGEGCNKMFLVHGGKVIWTYSTGKGWEYDDVWMLSNGNILYSRMAYAAEVTPQKMVVWRREAPAGREIHTVQPLGLDKVMLVENAKPTPRLLVINTKTGAIEVDHAIPYPDVPGVHGQFRRFRVTAQGTYLAAYMSLGKVVEYDQDFNEIWSYKIRSPWAAIRLRNGHTLITDEAEQLTREVNSKGETVWEFDLKKDLPAGIDFSGSQTCTRLANGNTILCSRGGNGKNCQLIEVTPDKKVIWALKDWANLGPATAVQILEDPGVPENPGESEH